MLYFIIYFLNNLGNIFAIAISVFLLYHAMRSRRLPPGPTGLPYIGYWPFLSTENCHKELFMLTKKYGDIFSFTITGRTMIHFGSMRAIKEANILKADCFTERWQGFNTFKLYLNEGLVNLPKEGWATMRKFFLHHFREKGVNILREGISDHMYDIIKRTTAELSKAADKPIDFSSFTVRKSSNILLMTLLNESEMTQQEMHEFQELYGDIMNSLTNKTMLLTGNFSKYFMLPFMGDIRRGKKKHQIIQKMLYKLLSQRLATFRENITRDIFDAYIKERNNRRSINDSTAKYFTDECLVISLIQIIGDGVLFVASFIMIFFKSLLDHPEEQEKIYKELIDVCGLDRDPRMEDKKQLTYTNAFILEVMRTSEFFPICPSLECTKETTLGGWPIPKGADTVYNFYAAHMNPIDYPEPEKFNPSRFIPKDGKRPDLVTIFGMGKRACIGEGFTMNQVFLFLTTVVKNFRLTNFVDPEEKETMNSPFKIDDTSHTIKLLVNPRREV